MAFGDKKPTWQMTRSVAEDFAKILGISMQNVQEIKKEAQQRVRQCSDASCLKGRHKQCLDDFGAMLAMAKKPTLNDIDRQRLAKFHKETGCCNDDGMTCRMMKAQPRGATLIANYYNPGDPQVAVSA